MPEGARDRILSRLRCAPAAHEPPPSDFSSIAAKSWPEAERLPRLRRLMEAVRTELLDARRASWPAVVRDYLRAAGARNLMYGPRTEIGRALEATWADAGPPALVPYDRPVEEIKAALFSEIDAGITSCLGGIAETGSLVLRPSPEEPRLLSLVPPIHLALLDPGRLWNTLSEALCELGWASGMPPNALLISGPSKTADIEQTLAYGVHGPKRLVVVVLAD
jgi:L-lactate dehydrogenase complex protein LldG